jgi:hypothetical protein
MSSVRGLVVRLKSDCGRLWLWPQEPKARFNGTESEMATGPEPMTLRETMTRKVVFLGD